MKLQTLGLLAMAVVGIASRAQATAITVPPGLNPGDIYRIIFVTSTSRDATSSNIADYNVFVTTAANSDAGLFSLGTTWTALASTSTVNALSNAGLSGSDTTTPFYNTLGQRIALGTLVPTSGLYGGPSTSHSSQIHSEGGGTGILLNWTGTSISGTTLLPLGGGSVRYGRSDLLTASWTEHGASPGDTTSLNPGLYGISADLVVPGVPEPGSIALTGMGAAALVLFLRFRQARK